MNTHENEDFLEDAIVRKTTLEKISNDLVVAEPTIEKSRLEYLKKMAAQAVEMGDRVRVRRPFGRPVGLELQARA